MYIYIYIYTHILTLAPTLTFLLTPTLALTLTLTLALPQSCPPSCRARGSFHTLEGPCEDELRHEQGMVIRERGYFFQARLGG